ncbi:hypothetical protein OK016_20470 [Vibrio chagasii]|nr:hypothetical protein [Vibrio chagasii]
MASPHMNLLVTGVMLLLVFSRLFGMGSWHNVMGDDYVRAVKNIGKKKAQNYSPTA